MAEEGSQEPPVPIVSHFAAIETLPVDIEEAVEAAFDVLVQDLALQMDGLLNGSEEVSCTKVIGLSPAQ